MVNNYLLKGMPTWNVPLYRTLNKLPPSLHKNYLPEKAYENGDVEPIADVDAIKTCSESSYVMSCSNKDGSVNVWSTQLGLYLAGGYNFRRQAFTNQMMTSDQIKTAKSVELSMLKFPKAYSQDGVEIYLKHAPVATAHKQEAGGVELGAEVGITEQDEDALELFGGLFSEAQVEGALDDS